MVVSLLILFVHFVLPFFVLLSRNTKRYLPSLAVGCAIVLVMHLVEMYWIGDAELPATPGAAHRRRAVVALARRGLSAWRRRCLSGLGVFADDQALPNPRWRSAACRGPSSSRTHRSDAMAAEKTDPKIGLIVGVAVASIGTFLGLHSLLVSYYDIEEHAELQAKILGQPAADLHRQRDSERTRLENGAVPITQAMELMARGGRPQVIEPTGSVDFAPMQGWMQRPRHFTPPPSVSALCRHRPAGAAPGDARRSVRRWRAGCRFARCANDGSAHSKQRALRSHCGASAACRAGNNDRAAARGSHRGRAAAARASRRRTRAVAVDRADPDGGREPLMSLRAASLVAPRRRCVGVGSRAVWRSRSSGDEYAAAGAARRRSRRTPG